MTKDKHKLIVILGPTTTGKSDLAVRVAKEFGGEVISADSRQVYRELDIGTGKIKKEEMQGTPHHLIDVAYPNQRFTVAEWKKQAQAAIDDIESRGRIPVICGGTGYYISALIDGIEFPEIDIDQNAQAELESKSADDLYYELKRLDPKRAASMAHDGESKNKRRLARAILIVRELGHVPDLFSKQKVEDVLLIGLILPDAELKRRITERLIRRLNNGMIEEAMRLHENGLSYERMNELGLEYRYLSQFLQGKLDREQLIDILSTKIWQYARRQKTWFKRDTRIHWFSPEDIPKISESVADYIGKTTD